MNLGNHCNSSPESGGNRLDCLPLNSAFSTPWNFLRPTQELHITIVDTAKGFLDSLAFSVSNSQTIRQQNNRKRKRSEDDQDVSSILRLKQLHVEGFTTEQIWEQASRIFDSASEEIERDCFLRAKDIPQPATDLLADPKQSVHTLRESADSDDNGSISDSEDLTDQSSVGDEQGGWKSDSEANDLSLSDQDSNIGEEQINDENSVSGQSEDGKGNPETYIEDRFGLNDGFFSIDDFNKQTELFEQQDTRGGLDDESDEDDVDWHANPLTAGSMKLSSKQAKPAGHKPDGDDSMDESDEEDGPTFDNIDFQDDSELDDNDVHPLASGDGSWVNTSDIMYADFFAPPPRKASTKKSRPLPKTQPREAISDNDIDRAMADVRRDLFEDEMSGEDSDGAVEKSQNPRAQHSTHEKERARIADEIRRLEAANVAKKEWMLSGEARAVERPVNSLIEEDLDFERVGKPVPVVTTELSESIEELIKRRIIAKEFDEVLRRRPGLSDRQSTQKARIELEDSKPQQSLADLYEADHAQANDPNYVDPKNQKLMKEHAEISNLWKEISSQLDTLSNWHYKPRAPQASINIVTDVATITMEDAQPTTSGAVRGSVTLAPQEIYSPGDVTRASGELVMKNGVPITKEELTREEKAKLRRRHKKQIKSGVEPSKQQLSGAAEKQKIVSDLKKAGVKLIGKEGEMTDINGSKIAGGRDKNGAHAIKL